MRTVIFDLDGTLADTSRDLINAANTCFRELGLGDVLTHPGDAGTALRGGRAMLTLGLDRAGFADMGEIDRQYPRLLAAYGADVATHTVLYPGALAAIEGLKSAGYAVGICTNKPEGLAETLMAALGVRDAFASLIGADTLAVRKPDPATFVAAVERAGGNVAHSLLVGDTETDHRTARAAGVPSILVTFGPGGRGVLDLNPDGSIDHFDGLLAEVQRLIG